MTGAKKKYLIQTAVLTLLLAVVGGWAYATWLPEGYFSAYPLIPVFFFVCGVFIINMVESCRRLMPGRMLQILMLARFIRMFFSVVVMLIFCVVFRELAKAFLLSFIVNYLVYLIYDSWFFFVQEAELKLKKNENNETHA